MVVFNAIVLTYSAFLSKWIYDSFRTSLVKIFFCYDIQYELVLRSISATRYEILMHLYTL